MDHAGWKSAPRLGLGAACGLLAVSAAVAGQGLYGPLELRPKDAELVEKSGEIDELLHRRGQVEDEGAAADLVRRVGAAVAPRPPSDPYLDFRFAILRSPVPNAFALPDGRVFVHEGLLALLENEAQLASVLAHECTHAEGHHAIVHSRQARHAVGGLLAFEILLGAAAPQVGALGTILADQLVSTLVVQAIIGYGRDLEEEADRRAVARLLEAGYDPREMPRTFELLAADPEGERPDPKPKWSSHPLAVQRAAYTRELLRSMEDELAAAERRHGGLRVGESDFGAVVAESALHSVREYLDADRPRTAAWLSQRNVSRWPGDPRFQAQLGDSWRLLDARSAELPDWQLTRRAKKRAAKARVESTRQERLEDRLRDPAAEERRRENLDRAEEAYEAALELDSEHGPALRGMGELEEARDRDLEAGRWYARYLRAEPEAADAAVVLRRMEAITERLRTAAGGRP